MTFKDKNGNPINIGDTVIIDGHVFDVEINPFTNEVVVDGDTGQVLLKDVHHNLARKLQLLSVSVGGGSMSHEQMEYK